MEKSLKPPVGASEFEATADNGETEFEASLKPPVGSAEFNSLKPPVGSDAFEEANVG